jgi:hypothetical protein
VRQRADADTAWSGPEGQWMGWSGLLAWQILVRVARPNLSCYRGYPHRFVVVAVATDGTGMRENSSTLLSAACGSHKDRQTLNAGIAR